MLLPPYIRPQLTKFPSRTHYVLEELRDVGLAGRKVDFLYVSMTSTFLP